MVSGTLTLKNIEFLINGLMLIESIQRILWRNTCMEDVILLSFVKNGNAYAYY